MKKLLLLIGASARSQLRWAGEHIYIWMVLAPIVLGLTCFTASRVATNLPAWQPSPLLIIILAALIVALLIAVTLSRASSELYHLRRAESYFDALPIDEAIHLRAALITRLSRTAALALVALIFHARFGGGELFDPVTLIALALFAVITSLAEIHAAMNWIHWDHKKDFAAAIIASIILLVSAGVSGALLAIAFRPEYFSQSFKLWLAFACILFIIALYLITHRSHSRWRASDMEYARRLESPNRLSVAVARAIERRFAPKTAAQVARDLQLTLRAFSSAVYVVAAVFALWVVALVVALTTNALPPIDVREGFLETTWRVEAMAIKFACVFAIASIGALVPVLVAYELPMMWVERAAGTTGLDLLEAKLRYARIITLPAPFIIWLAGLLTGRAPLVYALPLLAECLLLWFLVSTVIGSLAFEIPNRPGIAIIVTTTTGMAAGLISSMLWLVGIIIYIQAKDSLIERGRHRARYYLITEGD